MSLSETITTAVAETCLPEGCKACQRKGLPILLLRKAMVPDVVTQFHEPLNGDAPLRASAGLRTLRTGYLYVLLDRKHWQAYEVTPQAALRRFNPYQPYLGEPTPLPTRCVHENHEIPSSFLMLDDKRYSSALLAFANDPWPSSVLDAYKDGRAPLKRFQALDLKAAREDPASVGMAITEKQEVISQSVFEYVQYNSGPWDSVHGFHSQRSRMHHLLRYTTTAEREHKLKNGVLAFVLNDFVGLIQESNAQRLAWVARRQAWRENPDLAYQLLTSQCLLAIRASHRPRADMEARDFKPMMADGSPVFLDPEVERQLVIKQNAEGFDKRLEERYDEKKRAKFQARYDRIEARFQALIGSFTADYVIACNFRGFNTLQQFDYDPADERSRLDYTKTMARCLRGGITDPPRTSDEQPLGPSEQLWQKWLSDPDSPAFKALTLSDTNLLGGLLPSFTAGEATDWKDSVKLYAAVAALIGSKEGQLWLRDPVRANIAQVLSAINGAAARLDRHVGMGAHRAISYLNVAGQALHNGVRLIELKVSMSVAAYYAVQSQHIRQAYNAASEALPKPPAYWPANNIRPIILGGVLSLATLDPTAGSKLISVSVWVSGNAEELQRSLQAGARVGADLTKAGFSSITVVGGMLDANGRALLNGVRINATQAAGLLADSLRGLRGAATSSAVLLGVGSLYLLNDMLKKNLQTVELAIGPKKGEAIIALAGTGLALLGGSVQVLGKLVEIGVKPLTGWEKAGQAGEWLAKKGAFISAAVGFVDMTQAVFARRRSIKSGDDFSATLYAGAGFLSGASGAVGIIAAINGSAFFGPLGIAVALGLVAFGLYKWAESSESNALEQWARRCYFGNAGEIPQVHWDSPDHANVAIAELNAAILGIETALTVEAIAVATGPSPFFRTPSYIDNIRFAIKIPGYNPQTSAYFWKLTLHRDIDIRKNEIAGGVAIARQDYHASALSQEVMTDSMTPLQIEVLGNTFEVDEPTKIIKTLSAADGSIFHAMIISGGAKKKSVVKPKNIVAATLSLIYWPDRDQPDSFAHIVRVEQA